VLALRLLVDVDLDATVVHVQRSLEEKQAGLPFKALPCTQPTELAVALGLQGPPVSFHALRHAHASALIPAGLDVVAITRSLGHANPTVTLNIYGYLFKKDDSAAAMAIDAVMG
jgi:hypothetical protein